MSKLKKVEDWTSEETFQYMDNVMRTYNPNIYFIIRKIIESKDGYKPTDQEVKTAVMLDLIGFIPKEVK